ncbi:hypothetical protein ACQ4LE_010404 [Meloidogyne hapla]
MFTKTLNMKNILRSSLNGKNNNFSSLFSLIFILFLIISFDNLANNYFVKSEPIKSEDRTEQNLFGKLLNNLVKEEEKICTVRIQVVKKITGKCVQLHGGITGCQTDKYLDVKNEECEFA